MLALCTVIYSYNGVCKEEQPLEDLYSTHLEARIEL